MERILHTAAKHAARIRRGTKEKRGPARYIFYKSDLLFYGEGTTEEEGDCLFYIEYISDICVLPKGSTCRCGEMKKGDGKRSRIMILFIRVQNEEKRIY